MVRTKHLLVNLSYVLAVAAAAASAFVLFRAQHPAAERVQSDAVVGGASGSALLRVGVPGDGRIERAIRSEQARLDEDGASRLQALERLGWLYSEKARAERDSGYLHLVLEASRLLADHDRESALLLRGHALHGLHRFAEALPVAVEVVGSRGMAEDHALVGDILFDMGRLRPARAAYRRAMRRKPNAHVLARTAELRRAWGDLPGAVDSMVRALRATPPTAATSVAEYRARLATFLFEQGSNADAERLARIALRDDPEDAAALLVLGHCLREQSRAAAAALAYAAASGEQDRPAALWALEEVQAVLGAETASRETRERLLSVGARAGARTFAQYLAVRSHVDSDPAAAAEALVLAKTELASRRDARTHAAMAAALLANDRVDDALRSVERALAKHGSDARTHLTAARVYDRLERTEDAHRHASAARARRRELHASERTILSSLAP